MTDPEYVPTRAEKAARKELGRAKNLVDKYLNIAEEPTIKVNTRLAKSNLEDFTEV